jgi:hypothetical protein
MLLFQMTSCKKVDAQTPTTTLTKDQILVAKTWEVDKNWNLYSGQSFTTYTRGGVNTSGINYDNLRFTFNSNGTGINIDQFGKSYNFTWQFASTDKRSLSLTVNGRTDIWEMLEIAGNYLHASANLNIGGNTDNIETFRLIQIP